MSCFGLRTARIAILLLLLSVTAAVAQTSPDCTLVPPAPSITDGTGGVWTIAADQGLYRTGVYMNGIAPVIEWNGGRLWAIVGSTTYVWNGMLGAGSAFTPTTMPACSTTTTTTAVSVTTGTLIGWVASGTDATHPAPDGYKFCVDGSCADVLTALQAPVGTLTTGTHTITARAYYTGKGETESDGLVVSYSPPVTTTPNKPGKPQKK